MMFHDSNHQTNATVRFCGHNHKSKLRRTVDEVQACSFLKGVVLWFWFEFQLSSYYLPSLKQMLFDAFRKLLVNAVPVFFHKACDLFFF